MPDSTALSSVYSEKGYVDCVIFSLHIFSMMLFAMKNVFSHILSVMLLIALDMVSEKSYVYNYKLVCVISQYKFLMIITYI